MKFKTIKQVDTEKLKKKHMDINNFDAEQADYVEGYDEGLVALEQGRIVSEIVGYPHGVKKYRITSFGTGLSQVEEQRYIGYIRDNTDDNQFHISEYDDHSPSVDWENYFESYKLIKEETNIGLKRKYGLCVMEKPIGLELRVRGVTNKERVRREIGSIVKDCTCAEVFYTSPSTDVDIYNVKYCSDSDIEYFVHTDDDVDCEDCTSLIEKIKDHLQDKGVELLGHNRMIEGSLPYKTREAGRKDGTGRIQRPW